MKIAYFEAEQSEPRKIREAFPKEQLTVLPEPLNENTVAAADDAEVVSVFVCSCVTEQVLDQMPNLKLITTRSTGFDHIDLVACKRRGITVCNIPTYGENTVAEHAFALILAFSRKIFQSYERTEKMNFDRHGLTGFDLFGKTLGVVGTGNIGRHAIRIGRGFSMRVVAYDVKKDARLAAELNFTYADSLEDLLGQSDVITLHVPYITATHHLINKENVKDIKRGAILVNTSRGAIVETEALLWALEKKILSGAGLDVLEEENDTYEHIQLLSEGFPKNKDIATILRNHILIDRTDVIITPHNAFNSVEAAQRIFDVNADNIRAFEDGRPINVVMKK
jgi:D-lactate dehydrogenase